MRVSTNMIYDKGLQQMQAQSAELLHTQQQVSSGRRILTPADDPIAAARALEVRQSQSVNTQFLNNQAAAEDRLRTTENRLTGVGDIMQYMRERAVQAGGAALGSDQLGYIATDLRAQFEALVGLANSRDAQGDYVFSGFQTDKQPYVGSFGDYAYQGDDNAPGVQVSASRTMPVGFAGSDVFGSARLPEPGVQARSVPAEGTAASFNVSLSPLSIPPPAGSSYTVRYDADSDNYSVRRRDDDGTETDLVPVAYDSIAQTLTFDGGVVLDVTGAAEDGDALQVFVGTADIVVANGDESTGLDLALSASSAEPDAGVRYIVGYSIGESGAGGYSVVRRQPGVDTDQPVDNLVFDPDAGTLSFDNADGDTVSFDVTGAPRDGDQAEVFVVSRDIFANMALFIDALERPGPSQVADGPVAFALDTLDMGLESVMRVRAQIGSQLMEIENLGTVAGDQGLQYASEISRLEDLDYAEAISRLSRQQVFLEAAQQSYLRVTGLSLFNFLS